MRRLLLLGLFWSIGFYPAYAQWNDDIVNNNAQATFSTGIYGYADFASSAITSQFAYNFLMGNYLDSTLKSKVVSNLKKTNRLGFNQNYGMYAVIYNDTLRNKRVFNFFFALRHKSYFNASFTTDDFNLAFYGNAAYAGKTAIISPLVLNNLTYQQAELGLVCTNFGGQAQFGIGFSFLAGQNYTSFDASSASLYTDPYGQSLVLSTNTEIWQSDTSKGYQYRLNGLGASTDVYFRAPYVMGSKKGKVTISVNDIGFIWWNNRSINYQKDTSYSYNGITINSLSDLQSANFNSLSKDSLQKKYLPFTKQSFYAPIPTTLRISSNTELCKKFHLQLGYLYLFNANDVGYIYAQGDTYFNHGWIISLQAGYGDYNGINGTLMMSKQFKRCKLELAVNHVEGIIIPAKFGGAGAYMGYIYSFGK